MSPAVEEQSDTFKNYSRPALRPSFMCNIFGCKDEYTKIDEYNSYLECKRCGERTGFSNFNINLMFTK